MIENEKSSAEPITSSVLQGSVLGPLLFLIFINDITSCVKNSKIKLFADDCKIYIAFLRTNLENASQLFQDDLNALSQWAAENQLKIVFSKCAILHIGRNNPEFKYYFETEIIPSVNSIRDLGVMITHDLQPYQHILKICNSANTASRLIFKTFYIRSHGFLINMFKTFVRSKLEYACQVWNPHLKKDILALEKCQRKFTKRLPGLSDLPYEERLSRLRLESLELRRIHLDLCLVYKITRGLVDLSFDDFFTAKTTRTRGHRFTLSTKFCKKDIRKYFFSNRVVNIWNSLEPKLVEKDSLQSFKTGLKEAKLEKFLKGGGT